jgi:hypothetical protein
MAKVPRKGKSHRACGLHGHRAVGEVKGHGSYAPSLPVGEGVPTAVLDWSMQANRSLCVNGVS